MDERDDLSLQNEQGGSGGQMAQRGADAARKGADAARKAADAARNAKKAADAAKAAGSATKLAALAGTPIGWIILAVIVIIVFLIIFIGFYAYTVGAWGSMVEKLKDWGTSAWTSFKGSVIGKAEAMVTTDQIIEVANYLEDMGYDVEGSGLVSGEIIRESDVDFSGDTDSEGNRKWTLKAGVDLKDPNHIGTGKIVHVDSLYLKTYLISDNLSYLIKNFNQPFVGVLKGIITEIGDAFKYGHYYRTDSIGDFGSDKVMSSIGEGLIVLYKYKDGVLTAYNSTADKLQAFLTELKFGNISDDIKIDKDSKTLTLKRGWGNSSFTFKLDGWTGRYGMPLEFLLSVHMATMAPDLAYSLATSFNTEVRLALKVLDNRQIHGALNIPGVGWKTTAEFATYFENNGFSSFWGKLTGTINIGDKELAKFLNDCYATEEGQFDNLNNLDKLPENFKEYIAGAGYNAEDKASLKDFFHDAFLALRQTIEDDNFATYIPFIMEVSDHWYRDVYFTLSSSRFSDVVNDGGFIEVDQEYLEESEERWTLYEYQDVTFSDSQTGETFTETKYVINDDGTKKVDYLENKSELESAGLEGFDLATDFYWSAYEFDDSAISSQYEPVDVSSLSSAYQGFKDAADAGNDYLFANNDFAGAVTQKEDGLRGPTNPKIKQIFNDKYYIYDGTVTTAKAIEKDKVNALSGVLNSLETAMQETLEKASDFLLIAKIVKWAKPTVTFSTTDDGYFAISINGGEPFKMAIGVSKWVANLIPEEYKDGSLFKQVEINKDALTAFTILENTETQDADYIYKDFKELLVELDYFDKEELRETIVPVFQWMYKETGSAGWPVKKWEKDPVEYGTLIHSKVNLDFLKEKQYEEDEAAGKTGKPSSGTSKPQGVKEPTKKMENLLSPEEFLEVADEVHKVMEDQLFAYCILGPEKQKHSGSCGLDHPFSVAKGPGGHKLSCCATYVSWVLQEAEMNADMTHNGAHKLYEDYSEYFQPVTSYDDLEAGDIIFQTQGTTGCEGQTDKIGHVQICADTDQWYNAGSTAAIRRDSPYKDASYARSTFVIGLRPNGRDKITPFEGFEKDDLVLSPVTGRILRIGTIGSTDLIYHTANDDRELEIVKIENENPENEYVERLNYIEIEVLDLENPESILAGKDADTKTGYKLFLEDYIAQNCNGYIVRLEGYIHELNLGGLESAESEFVPPEASEYLRNKEEKEKEIEHLEKALPGFSAGGEYYIKEGTVLGKTTDCNMKISMFSLEESIAENIEDYIEIDEEELFPRQPYQAQEGDLELLANVMHHENCSIALEGAYGMSPEEAEMGNKGTGYVIINRALVNYGNYGTTIRDQIGAPGQYATAYLLEETQVHCDTCLEAAEWCLTWDCMSLKNQRGEEMARNVLSQSGWCFCQDGSSPGTSCWLYLDTVAKGTVNEYTKANPSVFDEFYCKNKAFEGYE